MKLGRRIGCSGSAVTFASVRRRAPGEYGHGSYFSRQLVWRVMSLWKQAVRWHKSTAQYGYDLQSYSLNFDDGCFHDHLSPLAP